MTMYQTSRDILEILYYIASIGLFVGILVAAKQLKVMKSDINSKNKRASVGKSIEYLNWYATEFIPEFDVYQEKLEGKKINVYYKMKNRNFDFDEGFSLESPNVMNSVAQKRENGAISLNNQLEFFSAAMMSGLADEELAFNPLAEAFCEFVEFNYDVYCYTRRSGKDTLFTHTISLYEMWKERLESLELQKEKRKIDEKMSKITDKRVKVLGTE